MIHFYSLLSIILQYWFECGENIFFAIKKDENQFISFKSHFVSLVSATHKSYERTRVFVKNLKKSQNLFFQEKNFLKQIFLRDMKWKSKKQKRETIIDTYGVSYLVQWFSLSLFKFLTSNYNFVCSKILWQESDHKADEYRKKKKYFSKIKIYHQKVSFKRGTDNKLLSRFNMLKWKQLCFDFFAESFNSLCFGLT